MPAIPAIPATGNRDNITLTDAAGQTYKQGALLVLDGSGNATECGADPALVYGVANHDAGKHPEGATLQIVSKAFEGQKFWMQCTSDPTIASNRAKKYGVVKDANGVWTVDLTDTTNTRVYIHDVDETRKMVLISFLEANRQIPA